MVSIDNHKLVICRFIEEIINKGDVAGIEGIISPNYFKIHAGTRYPVGIQGAKEHILGVRQTYPDLHLTIDRQIAEGEWVRPASLPGVPMRILVGDKTDQKKKSSTLE